MNIVIVAGGQTGIDLGAHLEALDLGAHLEALDLGAPIAGFMPADARNEDGPIPEHVALHLTRHDRTDPAARTRANVATADAALVIVQDRRRAGATRGTALTIGLCERRGWHHDIRLLVVDPTWSDGAVAQWARLLFERRRVFVAGPGPLRLLVAGPRASLWPDGEQQASRLVSAVLREVPRG